MLNLILLLFHRYPREAECIVCGAPTNEAFLTKDGYRHMCGKCHE
jgi:ribosomal protein S27AE